MDEEQREVRFDKYCDICEYRDREETDAPCVECLEEPVNVCSEKPVRFKEKD